MGGLSVTCGDFHLPRSVQRSTSQAPARARRTGSRASARHDDLATSVNAIRRILRALRLAARQTQASSGVSAAQLFVLRALATGESASLSELAESTMTDRSSVAAVVDRLLDGGFVKRETSSEDRRRASITITGAGRAMLKRAPKPPTALLMAGLEGLSASRLRALAAGLSALSREMGLEHGPAGMLFEDGVPESTRRPRAGRRVS